MTRDDFNEWVDYTSRVYESNEWTCSLAHHWEALKSYAIDEMKSATSTLHASMDTAYLMNHRRHGYGLITIIPSISNFKECIAEKSETFMKLMAIQRKNRMDAMRELATDFDHRIEG